MILPLIYIHGGRGGKEAIPKALCLTAKERSQSRGVVNWVKQDNLQSFIINGI